MATAEATKTEGTSGGSRGRAKKPSYLEEKGIKSIVTRPSVPNEYDPESHAALKEADFDDVLEFNLHKVDVHSFWKGKFEQRAEKLSSKTPEERAAYSKAEDSKDSLVAHFRKLKNSGSDVSELFASLKSELETAMSG